jgi:DNA helicase HerA-like ATPase
MDMTSLRDQETPPQVVQEPLGFVVSVSGSQVSVRLTATSWTPFDTEQATVGRLLGIMNGRAVIIGMITEVASRSPASTNRGHPQCSIARMDLVGEIKGTGTGEERFQRGVTEYPTIGAPAMLVGNRELRLIYGVVDTKSACIGEIQQDSTIGAHINIDETVSKHFAILGTTGVGKSSGVAVILQQILEERPDLRIFLVDPHNEYGRCFGDKAQVLAPSNLRLPFWLFNLEETADAFLGGRPGVEEEVEILSEVIPLAKAAYHQYRLSPDRQIVKKRDPRSIGYTADTPVPYRIEDLINLIDERMGKLENRSSRVKYLKLISRIQTFRNHPRYAFMFENANIGGDTMVEILSHLFRLPTNGKPMTVMQLAGFPAEVVDSVVSVLCRMAFDFGLWSDGVAPLLFVCEEAHRYAPADRNIGFGPTRRALSRIAKEGRKYGVFLGLATQRPAEIDATIISQCSTLFVMRMSNDRDQALIRSAVSDAAANLLTFIPSLGIREVFAFGAGVALPTRMKFKELPVALRPYSEAAGTMGSAGRATVDRGILISVVERWRTATMSQKFVFNDEVVDVGQTPRDDAAPLKPAQHQSGLGLDPQRFRTLRKPLDGGALGAPGQMTRLREGDVL